MVQGSEEGEDNVALPTVYYFSFIYNSIILIYEKNISIYSVSLRQHKPCISGSPTIKSHSLDQYDGFFLNLQIGSPKIKTHSLDTYDSFFFLNVSVSYLPILHKTVLSNPFFPGDETLHSCRENLTGMEGSWRHKHRHDTFL